MTRLENAAVCWCQTVKLLCGQGQMQTDKKTHELNSVNTESLQ